MKKISKPMKKPELKLMLRLSMESPTKIRIRYVRSNATNTIIVTTKQYLNSDHKEYMNDSKGVN